MTIISPHRHWKSVLAASTAFLCTAATPLHNPDLRFRVTIPDGFEPETESAKDQYDLYTFARPASDPATSSTVMKVKRRGGKLPPGVIVKGHVKNGFQLEPMSMTWKTHTLVGGRAVGDVGGQPLVSLTVQIPLKPEAISISIAGSLGDEQEISDTLRAILASVEGESNWISEGDRVTTEEGQKAQQLIAKDAYACAAIFIPVGIIVYLLRRGRRESPEPV